VSQKSQTHCHRNDTNGVVNNTNNVPPNQRAEATGSLITAGQNAGPVRLAKMKLPPSGQLPGGGSTAKGLTKEKRGRVWRNAVARVVTGRNDPTTSTKSMRKGPTPFENLGR